MERDNRKPFAALSRAARRFGIAVAGFGLVISGILLLVLPGPGILVILLGLAVLAREFAWAGRLLDRVRAVGGHTLSSARELLVRFRRAGRSGEA